MIGKTIICFLKRNILYFLGQNQYFFQHLHKNGCVCMCKEKGGNGSPQQGCIRLTALRRDPIRARVKGRGGYGVMCGHGFPVTTDNPPPSSRLILLQDFCILQT